MYGGFHYLYSFDNRSLNISVCLLLCSFTSNFSKFSCFRCVAWIKLISKFCFFPSLAILFFQENLSVMHLLWLLIYFHSSLVSYFVLSKFSSDHLFPQKSEGKKDFLSHLTSKLWAVFYWQDQYLGRSHFHTLKHPLVVFYTSDVSNSKIASLLSKFQILYKSKARQEEQIC